MTDGVFQTAIVYSLLRSRSFSLENERSLQEEVHTFLCGQGLEAQREYRLDSKSIIDIVVPIPGDQFVGIECKLKASRASIVRQCRRYLNDPRISNLILMSQTWVAGFPPKLWVLRPSGHAGLA